MMDKIEASILGIGLFAATQLVTKQNHIGKSMMRSNREDTQNSYNQDNTITDLNDEADAMTPGIELNDFVSEKYRISFKYPRSWSRNPRYTDKYEGATGFFEVGDFEGTGDTIDEAVNAQINEDYKPYGTNPMVRSVVVDGAQARIIYPSADQSSFFNDRDTAIVVQYPQPLVVDNQTYDYVVIWASRAYVPLIISTFKFVR